MPSILGEGTLVSETRHLTEMTEEANRERSPTAIAKQGYSTPENEHMAANDWQAQGSRDRLRQGGP
jgi:hypothetical protein